MKFTLIMIKFKQEIIDLEQLLSSITSQKGCILSVAHQLQDYQIFISLTAHLIHYVSYAFVGEYRLRVRQRTVQ